MPQNTRGNFSSDYVISEEVLATIAANAAKDVEGVARLGSRPADLYTTFKIGADASKMVAVTMTDYDIRCHVYIDLVPPPRSRRSAETSRLRSRKPSRT